MNTARKAVMIVATVLVVGGAALSFGAFAAAGYDLQNLSNTRRDWVPERLVLPAEDEAPHDSIVVKGSSENVRFEPGDGDAIEVAYWTNADREVSVVDQDGAITIQDARWSEFRIMMFSMGDFQDRSTVVKVPRSFAGSISVETAGGDIDAAQLEGLESMYLSSRNGNVGAARTSAQSVELRSQNGSIEATGVTSSRFIAKTQSGSATLTDLEADEAEASSENGSVYLIDMDSRSLNAESANGSIVATALAADDIKLSTNNGGIEAVIDGSADDYAIDATSSNGWVEAPKGSNAADAPKRLTARSQNGHIELGFAEGGAVERREGTEAPRAPKAPAPPEAPAAPSAA